MTIDHCFKKQYHETEYNCAHFVCDVWFHLTRVDISLEMQGFLMPPDERFVYGQAKRNFRIMKKPISPCIVQGEAFNEKHVGVFFNNRILHLSEDCVRFESLISFKLNFKKVKYLKCLKK